MTTATLHFSPVTKKYAKCNASKRPCRYGASAHITEKEFYATQNTYGQPPVSKKPVKRPAAVQDTVSSRIIEMTNIDGVNIDARIAVSKDRPLFCAHCRTSFTKEEHEEMLSNASVEDYPCGACGKKNTWNDCGVDILKPDAKLLDKEAVKENLWFHVTKRKNWIEDINASGAEDITKLPMIHVGSKEAALDRLAHLSEGKTGQKWYLYAVKVNPVAPIADKIHGDEDDFPVTYGDAHEEQKKGYAISGVTRYVNRYEAPGTISLLANPSAIKVVETRELDL